MKNQCKHILILSLMVTALACNRGTKGSADSQTQDETVYTETNTLSENIAGDLAKRSSKIQMLDESTDSDKNVEQRDAESIEALTPEEEFSYASYLPSWKSLAFYSVLSAVVIYAIYKVRQPVLPEIPSKDLEWLPSAGTKIKLVEKSLGGNPDNLVLKVSSLFKKLGIDFSTHIDGKSFSFLCGDQAYVVQFYMIKTLLDENGNKFRATVLEVEAVQ